MNLMGRRLRMRLWGTWEELVLGGAVLRHGAHNWDAIADEVRARTTSPHLFTPQECQSKYEDIQEQYSGCDAWFEELRKRRVAELKRELEKSEDSIGSLQSKLETLTYERETDSNSGYNTSQTESIFPAEDAEGLDSSSKEVSKDGTSAGSFTEETDRRKEENENLASVSVQGKNIKMQFSENTWKEKFGCGCLGINFTILKKKRGKRKRKGCNIVKEGSMGYSDTLSSAPFIDREESTEGCNHDHKPLSKDYDGNSGEEDSHLDLAGVMDSIMKHKDVSIFKSRLESQKRARYKKMIRRHVDFRNISLRIGNGSISSSKELFRDLYLLCNNALVFYPINSLEYKSALVLRDLVKEIFMRSLITSQRHQTQNSTDDGGEIPNIPVKPKMARSTPQQSVTKNAAVSGKGDHKISSIKENKVVGLKREGSPLVKESGNKGGCRADDVALESPSKKKGNGRIAKGCQRGGRKRQQETPNRGRKRTRK